MDTKQLTTTLLLFAAMMLIFFFVVRPGGGGGEATKVVAPALYQVPATAPAVKGQPATPTTVVLGSVEPNSGYKLALTLTNVGAGVQQVELTDYWETYKHTQHLRMLEARPNTLPPFATVRVWLGDASGGAYHEELKALPWRVDSHTPDEAQLVAFVTDPQQRLIEIRKIFRVEKGTYNVQILHQVKNLAPAGTKGVEVAIDQLGSANLANDSIQMDMRSYQGTALNSSTKIIEPAASGWGVSSKHSKLLGQPALESTWATLPKRLEEKRKEIEAKTKAGGTPAEIAALQAEYHAIETESDLGAFNGPNPLVWVATANRFFTVITRPVSNGKPVTLADGYTITLPDNFAEARVVPLDEKNFAIGLPSARFPVAPGGQAALELTNFMGPKDPNVLTADYAQPPGSLARTYAEYGYRDVIHYSQGGCYGACTFGWLAKFLLDFLHILHTIFRNYGIAIMVLVIIVRLLLHPLTRYSQVNMTMMQKKMAKLQPEIERVKKKYEKDKARQQQELMAVYKEHNVNPAGGIMGCLPMLLQIPIWAALWGGLAVDINLRQASFIPGWINDLSNPDIVWPTTALQIGHYVFKVPLFGMEIYGLALLPLFLMVVFFAQMQVQMRMMPKPADPQQAQTQKISQYMILIFPIFLYNAPSGLNLYIFASTIGGLFDSWLVRRHIKQRELAEEGGATK